MYLSVSEQIPNLKIYTPITNGALRCALEEALQSETPCAIRYPNEHENEAVKAAFYGDGEPCDVGVRANYDNPEELDAVLILHGRIVTEAMEACKLLKARGLRVGILLLEQIKPYGEIAEQILPYLPKKACRVVFVEEEIRAGGFGMMLTDALRKNGCLDGHPFGILAVEDSFVPQDKPEPILRTAGVDAAAMVAKIKELLGR